MGITIQLLHKILNLLRLLVESSEKSDSSNPISSEHCVKIRHFRELVLYVWVGVISTSIVDHTVTHNSCCLGELVSPQQHQNGLCHKGDQKI